jgi:hypothetical protein
VPSRIRSGVLAGVLLLLTSCGSAAPRAIPDINALECPSPLHARAPQPSSLPALVQLSAFETAPLHGTHLHSGHGHAGPELPIDAQGATARALGSELRAAAAVACDFDTTAAAARAGYVRSANFTQGVGTHWTNWGLINAPFDPTRPAMLLYAPRLGHTHLIGFSYWVRSPNPLGPDGFSGTADSWHRHYGLCFDRSGLLERENVNSAQLCAGTYLNGQDMWMLHAWIVPGSANAWGTFAPLNPQLCSRTVADIERCPGFDGP